MHLKPTLSSIRDLMATKVTAEIRLLQKASTTSACAVPTSSISFMIISQAVVNHPLALTPTTFSVPTQFSADQPGQLGFSPSAFDARITSLPVLPSSSNGDPTTYSDEDGDGDVSAEVRDDPSSTPGLGTSPTAFSPKSEFNLINSVSTPSSIASSPFVNGTSSSQSPSSGCCPTHAVIIVTVVFLVFAFCALLALVLFYDDYVRTRSASAVAVGEGGEKLKYERRGNDAEQPLLLGSC